jgi:hypothetical protein
MEFTIFPLLDTLIKECPNAWIKVGEELIPTRKELWTFELFQRLFRHDQFKLHNGLPIIITLTENYSVALKLFHHQLVYHNGVLYKDDLSREDQVLFLLFMDSIMIREEILKFLGLGWRDLGNLHERFSLEVWIDVMELNLKVEFLSQYDRIKLCYAIYLGSYYGDDTEDELYNNNERKILKKNPELAKALKFFKVEYSAFVKTIQYQKKCRIWE